MDLKLLIDGIVRQTTVLIAQISTSSGVRSPLSHVVDQVFFELASEISGSSRVHPDQAAHVRQVGSYSETDAPHC